jgi:hypothetical protein
MSSRLTRPTAARWVSCASVSQVTYEQILETTRRYADEFVWDSIPSIEELGRVRMVAMHRFLDDFASGKVQGRYVDAGLLSLSFEERKLLQTRRRSADVAIQLWVPEAVKNR